MGRDMGGEEKEMVGLPDGNEKFVLCRFGERARVDMNGYITRFDGLEIDENLFGIDSAHVHLAGVDAEQRIIPPIPAGGRRSLGPAPIRLLRRRMGTTVKPAICFVRGPDLVDMAALYLFVVGDCKLDVEVILEFTDGSLLGVNGILDYMAWRGLAWRRVGARWRFVGRREAVTRKSLLEVVEPGEVGSDLVLRVFGKSEGPAPFEKWKMERLDRCHHRTAIFMTTRAASDFNDFRVPSRGTSVGCG